MKEDKILGYIFLSLSILFLLTTRPLTASNIEKDTTKIHVIKDKKPLKSVSVSFDIVGLSLSKISAYGNIGGALSLNFKNVYFPIVEAGLGLSDHTNEETNLHFKTSSPYFKIGINYNFLKNKTSGNRLLGGVRIGYTSFKYDLDGPDIIDHDWGGTTPFNYKGIKNKAYWLELVIGIETAITRNFHLGWDVRYKHRIYYKNDEVGNVWFIPGYGRNKESIFTGTFNIIFDI